MTNKEKKELVEYGIRVYFRQTRNEPGLSLREVAEIIKEVFTKEEVEALVKELEEL